MIPKIIHYCWFGGNPLPESALQYMESWKKYCPDYQIMCWNEATFDLDMYPYAREAYAAKKWAFVSDVARLYALVNVGGVYMDTDVEVIKPLDPFLEREAFSGFEDDTRVPTGLMAAEKGHPLFTELLKEYESVHFTQKDGTFDITTNVERITSICLEHGLVSNNTLQTVGGFTLYPKDYFCANDPATKEKTVTENTHTIHHFDGSWHTPKQKYIYAKQGIYAKKFHPKIARKLAVIQYCLVHKDFAALWEEVQKR